MKNYTRQQLLAGATALSTRGVCAPELKDAGALDQQVKAALERVETTFSAFKTKSEAELAELKAGRADIVTKTELKAVGDAVEAAKVELKALLDAFAVKTMLYMLNGGGDRSADELKAAEQFGRMIDRKDFSTDQLREYKSNLTDYMRRGVDASKAVTMQVGVDPAGGYFVTPDTSGRIVKKVFETTPMRQLASVITIGTDALEGIIDNGEAEAQWVGEMQTRVQTDTPQIGKWRIPVHELYSRPTVTMKLLEDAQVDVEAWLGDKVASKFARTENTAFTTGNGVNKPQGLFAYAMAATGDATRPWGTFEYVVTGTSGGWGTTTNGTDKLIDLIFLGKAAYRQNGKFLMSRATMGSARKLKDGQGNYAYALGMREGALVETMFGFQVYDGEDLAAYSTADAYAVAFGDFKEAYQIVDRLGISVIRDNITSPGFVKLNTRKRVGGGAVNFEAVKFLKFGTS